MTLRASTKDKVLLFDLFLLCILFLLQFEGKKEEEERLPIALCLFQVNQIS